MNEPGDSNPLLSVRFFASSAGNEPVREWLLGLGRDDRRIVGSDIKTAQYGWPLGMPLIRQARAGTVGGPLAHSGRHRQGGVHGEWFRDGAAARVREEVSEDACSRPEDGKAAARGPSEGVSMVDNKHIGGDLDDFLREEGMLDDAEAVATKRVIAYQIAQEMERAHITQTELARRMKTSRSAVERLLDPANPSVTLSTLERAASAVGKRLKVQLTA